MSFNRQKAQLLAKSKLDKLREASQKQQKGGYEKKEDHRFWKPTITNLSGSARIRFLPNKNPDDLDVISRYECSKKNPATGKWYIENSLTSLDMPDPAYEYNGSLLNTYGKDSQEFKNFGISRKQSYFANILVLKDDANPENEGKVFIYKFGATIQKKLADESFGTDIDEDDGVEPSNPFDVVAGKNFKIIIEPKGEYPNFDKSAFVLKQTPIAETDEEIEEILSKCYDLREVVYADDQFKTYDELQKSLNRYLGKNVASQKSKEFAEDDEVLETKVQKTSQPKEHKVSKVELDDGDDEDFLKELEDLQKEIDND